MFRKFSLAALAIASFGVMPAQAEPVRYEFDKAHTQILFFSDHMGFSKQQAEFLGFDGFFTFDEAAPENSAIDVTIDTASIDMDMERWDDHMKNADFFNVTEYPEMTFKSTNVEVTGENTGKITGDLTLLGQTHPVVLDVVMNKIGEHPMKGTKWAGFTATGKLDRTQWGMNYGVPMMDPEIELRIDVEGFPQEAAEPAAEAEEGAAAE